MKTVVCETLDRGLVSLTFAAAIDDPARFKSSKIP
jgi:hypothetical protein